MRRNAKGAIVACAALLAAPGWATAQTKHFTFTVPVELRNLMPEVSQAHVNCEALSSETLPPSPGTIIGESSYSLAIDSSTGNFVGNVVVAFDAVSGKDPRSATHYRCRLSILTTTGGGSPGPDREEPFLQPKPGTPFVPIVSGPLPSS